MLLIEIGLAVAAFRRGWRWRVLWPFAAAHASGFLVGLGMAAGGGSADGIAPVALLLEIALLVSLVVMASRAPHSTTPVSAGSDGVAGHGRLALGDVAAPSAAGRTPVIDRVAA